MNLLNQSAFLKALGWSLLGSLWQMGLLWLVYLVFTANGRKLLSRQRHTIALLSLAGGSLWFLITFSVNFYKAANGIPLFTFTLGGNLATTTSGLMALINHWFEPALPFLSLAYLLTATFLFVRFYFQYRRTQQLYTTGLQKAHPEWRAFLQQLAGRMSIKKKVQIWLSSMVDTPVTLGFWKPVILLPVAAINHLSLKQAEAIILHELNHIRRNDYLVNLLIACVDVILFFNPFARQLSSIIRRERENCCDDLVLQFCYEPESYAHALLSLEKNRVTSHPLTVAATGKDTHFLLNRIKRILGKEPENRPVNHKLVAYLLSALLIGFIGWYNPGNLIVKKIGEVSRKNTGTEMAQNFATPVVFKLPPSPAALVIHHEVVIEKCKKTTPCCNGKDPYKKLEQIIELTTDARLAALNKQINEAQVQTANFVTDVEANDYSFPENTKVAPPPAREVYPYVPGNSFFSQPFEDTAQPKKYVMTYDDLKAQEAMQKALQGLQQIDWKKLETELKAQGKAIDMALIQRKIEKAMQQVDWKKVNEDNQQAQEEAQAALQDANNAYMIQLGDFQRERAIRQEKIKLAQQQILIERLQQREALRKLEEARKQEQHIVVKKRKIVQI